MKYLFCFSGKFSRKFLRAPCANKTNLSFSKNIQNEKVSYEYFGIYIFKNKEIAQSSCHYCNNME